MAESDKITPDFVELIGELGDPYVPTTLRMRVGGGHGWEENDALATSEFVRGLTLKSKFKISLESCTSTNSHGHIVYRVIYKNERAQLLCRVVTGPCHCGNTAAIF